MRPEASMTIALLALLSACSEYEVSPVNDIVPSDSPDIQIRPGSLSMGPLATGQVDEQVFTVKNIGPVGLDVSEIRLDVGQEAFTLLDTEGFTLAPDESREIGVQFTPVGEVSYGLAVVVSNDPDTPEAEVPLEGLGEVPALSLSPTTYYFPGVCDDSTIIELRNVGLADLRITSIDYASGPELVLDHGLSLPLTLAPNDFRDVSVDYTTGGSLSVTGTLSVESNDPRGVRTADQFVEGSGELVTEQYVVDANPSVDILFAVDKSCSMSSEARALGQAFDAFIAEIDLVTDDWQIGVVVQDGGCFERGIITKQTPNYVAVFKDAVGGAQLFGDTDLTESLLQLTDNALQKTASGNCNAGFVRGNSLLHIVAVSDEPEQSGQPWDYWVGRWQAQMSDPNLVMVSAVIDPTAGNCGDVGTGYIEAAQGTGGIILDVCTSNWGSYAQQLGSASASGLLTYLLSTVPDDSTIVVSVDGTSYPNGWSYDPVRNAVVIHVELPEGSEVEIAYTSIGC
jgi:hypothetical protein